MAGAVAALRWKHQLQMVADVLAQRVGQIRAQAHAACPGRAVRGDGTCGECDARDRVARRIYIAVKNAPPLPWHRPAVSAAAVPVVVRRRGRP